MVKYQNYFSIIFLLNLIMRDFLHFVKKKISQKLLNLCIHIVRIQTLRAKI